MKDFAKLFETQYGQVVVFLQDNEYDGSPEIRMFSKPDGLGICSAAFGFPDTDAGRQAAEDGFDKVTQEMAEASAKELSAYGEKE